MKLKLEFRILNQLTEIAQEKLRTSQAYFSIKSETISVASPMTHAAGGAIPSWTANNSPNTKVDTRHGDSYATNLIARARASLSCRSPPSRRFSQPDCRMAGVDEKMADLASPSFTRPSPVRAVTAPIGKSRSYKKHSLQLST